MVGGVFPHHFVMPVLSELFYGLALYDRIVRRHAVVVVRVRVIVAQVVHIEPQLERAANQACVGRTGVRHRHAERLPFTGSVGARVVEDHHAAAGLAVHCASGGQPEDPVNRADGIGVRAPVGYGQPVRLRLRAW